jgi:hypothetical protein
MPTFTVTATGTEPITYQWQEDNAGDNNFVNIDGANANTYLAPEDSVNQYRVIVTNECGEETSEIVSVTNPNV